LAKTSLFKRLVEAFGLTSCVYVDAGAFHPIFGSNTLLLSKQGWRGINIDLASERVAEFKQHRPNDCNVVAGLSNTVAAVEIAHYQIPSTDRVVDPADPEKLSAVGGRPIRFSTATTTTLNEIIRDSPFSFEDIKYLNIDCEGYDLAVLRGLDFGRCRPRIVSVEAWNQDDRKAIEHFLSPYDYRVEVVIPPTLILVTG
jgi:FkbM family methyltransferase